MDDSKDNAAQAAIARCVAELRGLAPNGRIPIRWKNAFIKALVPPPSRRGRRISPSKYAAIAADIAEEYMARHAASANGRSARGINASQEHTTLTAQFKQNLSKKHQVSTRTVESVALAIRRAFEKEASVPPDTLRAIIDGIANSLGTHITRD